MVKWIVADREQVGYRKKINWRHVLLVGLFSFSTIATAQTPTINPEETVSLSTGAMGFALPLGNVKGYNGHDFPVNLYYHSGIRLDEEASPAGLGFSYEAGVIVRKEVFVSDDNHGGPLNYSYDTQHEDHVKETSETIQIFLIVVSVISFIISMIAPMAIATIFSATLSMFSGTMGFSSPADFNTGGTHCPSYTATDGKGFFNGGASTDLPDMYFVNCPYVNGQMVWVGGTGSEGRFVMKNTGGSAANSSATVKIIRNVDDKGFSIFEIVLKDGTRLFFDKHDDMSRSDFSFYHSTLIGEWMNMQECVFGKKHNKESVPVAWHLTKILYGDYVDGGGDSNDPLDSQTSNKGGWTCFTYDSIVNPNIVQAWRCSQAFKNKSAIVSRAGGYNTPIKLMFLKKIITPNQTASYTYKKHNGNYTRKDNLWFDIRDGLPFYMPELDQISINDRLGTEVRTISLKKDYSLRPATFSAFVFPVSYIKNASGDNFISSQNGTITIERASATENPHAAALTLKSILVADKIGNETYPISFSYLQWPEAFGYKTSWHTFNSTSSSYDVTYSQQAVLNSYEIGYGDCYTQNPKYVIAYPQMHDLWGYYLHDVEPLDHFRQFNLAGQKYLALRSDLKPCDKDKGGIYNENTPWSAAWSLDEIRLPDGLTIKWQYESNKCHYVNSYPTFAVDDQTGTQFSEPYSYWGGIRVQKISATTPHGKPVTWNYNYYKGYASALPYDYVNNDRVLVWMGVKKYRDFTEGKGGLYTQSTISYQKVRVAKNFNESTGQYPNGYTEYEFTHSGFYDDRGYYPNNGYFYDVDLSWKRGLLLSSSSYNNNGYMVSKIDNEYDFSQQIFPIRIPTNDDPFTHTALLNLHSTQNTVGWARLKQTTTTINGISTVKTLKYATDLTETPDNSPNEIVKGNVKTELWPNTTTYSIAAKGDGKQPGASVIVKYFGDPAYDDYVFAMVKDGSDFDYIVLSIVKDINKPLQSNETWEQRTAINKEGIKIERSTDCKLIGIAFLNVDGGTVNNDLITVCAETNRGLYGNEVAIIRNVAFNNNPNTISFDRTPEEVSSGYMTGLDLGIKPKTTSNLFVSCAIGNFIGDSKPDIVFLEGNGSTEEGGIVNFGKNISRHILVCRDISFPNQYAVNYEESAWTQNPIIFPGKVLRVIHYNGSTTSDLEITGYDAAETNPPFRVHRRIFKNLQISSSNVVFDQGSPLILEENIWFNSDTIAQKDVQYLGKDYLSGTPPHVIFSVIVFPYTINNSRLAIIEPMEKNVLIPGDLDGQPNEVWTTAPNNKHLVTKTIPAYWKYDDMKPADADNPTRRHMLTQPCQTIVYEKAVGDNTPLSAADVRSSQVTTWSSDLGSNTWVPQATFSWNVPKSSSGIPMVPFSEFDFGTIIPQPNVWQLTSSVEKYNAFSAPLETKNAKGISGSTIYRNDLHLPIASVTNAGFKGCGVFTCDYDLSAQHAGYFDYDNGWEKAGGSEIYHNGHFGGKSLRAESSWGALRTIKMVQGRDYVISAWVKKISRAQPITPQNAKNTIIGGTYRKVVDPNAWPLVTTSDNIGCSGTVEVTGADGGWQFIKLTIPASKDITASNWSSGYQFAHFWVGATDGTVLIDDIRFHPVKAQVSTTYYDTKWQQPIISVDANNKPGKKVAYDDFGRPAEWWKIDAFNPYLPKLIEEKCYHLMNEEQPDFPNPESHYKIVSVADVVGDKDMCLAVPGANGNGDPVNIQSYSGYDVKKVWKIESDGCGCFYIKSLSNPAIGIEDPDGNIANNTVVRLGTVDDYTQKWRLIPTGDPDGSYKIATKANANVILDVALGLDNTVSSGDIVQVVADWNGPNQKWLIINETPSP